MRNKQGDEAHVPKSSKAPPRTGSLQSWCLSLEQRLMFDAAAAATAAEVAGEAVAQEQADAAVSADGPGESSAQESGEGHEVVDALTTFLPEPSPAEIVFVDPTVPDYATLLAGIDPNIEVVILDGGQDGITQMADALSGRTGIDAIHLISHGEAGTLQLGTGTLTVETMSGRYAEELSTIRQALSEQADILVYGCDFAAGETGQDAVDCLAQLTGADVQASSDLTGHASLGGDWELEVQTGAIEARIAIDVQEQSNWVGLLAAPVLDATKSPTLNSVLEDAGAPSGSVGTLVSSLVDFAAPSGQVDNVSDADSGAALGIAITGANTTNGTWWYSTNNGSTWNVLGAVSDGSARLLAADASTRIYFQANVNYNGTMSDAITFHAWDQTSGSNGGTANLTTTSTVRDEFNTVSYSNNNGTVNWGDSWKEIGESDGTSSGMVVVNSYAGLSGNSLQIETDLLSRGASRQVDLSGATSATLSFDYIRQHGGGTKGAVSVEVYNGKAWTNLQTFSIDATDASAQSVKIDISAYANANTQVRFIVSGSDSMGRLHVDNIQVTATGTGGGTSAYSHTSDTAALTVTPVNDAPTITNLSGDRLAYSEGDGAVVIDQGANALVADTDSANFDTGTLIVSIPVGAAPAEDVLSIRNQGTGAGQIGVSGSSVTYGGVAIGTFTGGAGGHNLAITFNSNATPSAVTAVVQNITYEDIETGAPAEGGFTIRFALTDGDGGASANYDVSVYLSGVNDAPVLADTALTLTVAEDAGAPSGAVGSLVSAWTGGVTDVDGGASKGIAVTGTDETHGTWYYTTNGGSTWTAVGAVSNTSALLLADNGSTRLYFSPRADYNGTSSAALTVRAWDRTSGSAGSKVSTVSNGGTTAFSSATDSVDVTVTPVNDAPTDVSLSANTVAENATNGTVVGTVSSTDPDGGDTKSYSLTDTAGGRFAIDSSTGQLTVADGSLLNYEAATSYTVTVQVTDSGGLTYDETFTINVTNVNEAPTGADATITISEDSSHIMTVTNFGFSDVDAGDSLSAVRIDTVPIAGSLSLAGVAVTAGQVIDVSDITAGSLVFTPAADAHGTGYASLTFSVRDTGGLYAPAANTLTVDVTAVHDAPVNTVPGAQTINEDTALALSGISVNDVDGNLSTVQLGVGNGTVSVTLQGTATISAGSNGSSTLTLSGSQADINATLATLVYQGSAHFNGADTLTVTSTDTNSGTDVDTVAITVTAQNDAPTLSVNTGSTAAEGGTDTITVSELAVTDVDNSAAQLTYSIGTGPTYGRLELTTAPGISATTFTQADIAANRLVYVHDGSESTGDNFTFTVSDGAGGSLGAASVTLTIMPANDAPTIMSNGGGATAAINVAEHVSAVTIVGGVDVDLPAQTLTYSISGGIDQARFTIDAVTGALEFSVPPDFEVPTDADGDHVYVVEVRVTDSQGGTVTQTLHVTVTDVYESRPPAVLPPSLVPTPPPAGPVPTPAVASSTPDAIAPVVKPVAPAARVASGESGIRTAQQAFGSGAVRPEDLRSNAPSTQREEPQGRPVDQPLPAPLMYSVEDVHVDEPEKPLSSAVLSELLFAKLDAVIEELEEAVAADAAQQVQVTRIAAATGVTLSVGFVAWALRSTVLLASLFGTLPAWQSLDPLPVLASHRSERKKSKAALEYVAREEQAEYRGLHELLDRKGERVPGSAEA